RWVLKRTDDLPVPEKAVMGDEIDRLPALFQLLGDRSDLVNRAGAVEQSAQRLAGGGRLLRLVPELLELDGNCVVTQLWVRVIEKRRQERLRRGFIGSAQKLVGKPTGRAAVLGVAQKRLEGAGRQRFAGGPCAFDDRIDSRTQIVGRD